MTLLDKHAVSDALLDWLRCPTCQAALEERPEALFCSSCKTSHAFAHGVPSFYGLLATGSTHRADPNAQDASTWTPLREKEYDFYREALAEVPESAVMLDLGAGQSHFAVLFQPYTHYAVDIQAYPGIDVLTDLTRLLPIRSDYFDVVVLSNVLEHCPEPELLLKEIHRILKKNGKLLMATPFLIKIHQAPYDFLRYTEYMFRYMLEKAGFAHTTIHPIGNVVGIHHTVSRAWRTWLLMEEERLWKRLTLRALFRVNHRLTQICTDLAGEERKEAVDTLGYPQGYGCIAIKS